MNCPKCKYLNPEGAKFCMKCGFALTEASPSIPVQRSERKQVTVLFSDLVGYTAMTERLDPEEVKGVMSQVFGQIAQVIAKYDGFIERFVGDAVMAIFGIPRVHEDDPVRAIRAAKEIHALVEGLSPRLEPQVGRPLAMHSGINTGLVVTGEVNFEKGTHGLAGDAINLAARLQGLAGSGEIIVGASTYKLAKKHFAFQPMPPTKVKGKAEPVPVFKLVSAQAPEIHLSLSRRVSSVMVGRDREMDRLEFQVHKAINGQGSVVNVTGEAGIGKSRLMAELKRREVMQRVALLEGRAISIGKNLSFHPIIDLLKHWARITEDDSEMQAFDKLERAIRTVHPTESDEILPFVATLMGMKLKGRHAERVQGIEGEALEKLIFKNFRDLIIKGSELRPMIIVMEDLHWADRSSLELLQSLYGLSEKYRLLFVNVFRPGYLEENGAKTTAGAHERIELQPLANQDSEALINNMLEIKGLLFPLKEQILHRAGGNPFFIEEVVRSLIDNGAVVKGAQGFEVTPEIDHIVIPPTINELLMARIDRLEEQTRELVKVASVIGRSFFDRILKDVADSIEDVDDRLAYLKEVQIIRERSRLQELEYLFSHALAQEAAYESTLLQQRKALHLKVAQSIEKIFQERLHEFYGMLAHHYSLADDAEKAEEYLTKAGEEALKSSASSEALNYLQEALKLYLSKYGRDADPDKLANLEKNIALAFYNRAQWRDATEYFQKFFNRMGLPRTLQKIDAVSILITIRNLLTMLKAIYWKLPSSKNIATARSNELFDMWYKNGQALSYLDQAKFFMGIFAFFRRTTKFDLNSIPKLSTYWAGLSGALAGSGKFFRLGNKLLEISQHYVNANDISSRINHACMSNINNACRGYWEKIKEFDQELLNSSLKNGDFWPASNYLTFCGLVMGEQGNFGHLTIIINKLYEIKETYDYDQALIDSLSLQSSLLLRTRNISEAIATAEKGILYSREKGAKLSELTFLMVMAQSQQFAGNQKNANAFVRQAIEIYDNFSLRIPSLFAVFYKVKRFSVELEQLKQAISSKSTSAMAELKVQAFKSGKAAVGISHKHALFKTETFKSMGDYYWAIGKQGKAVKWWKRAIAEDERLGARPDLSRAYFEVGKCLLEPGSKYKELNGIDAEGYLAKARSLFEEMDLQWDLDELEKIMPQG